MSLGWQELLSLVVSLILASIGITVSFQVYTWISDENFGGFGTLNEKSYVTTDTEMNSVISTTKYDIAMIPLVSSGQNNFRLRVYNTSSATPVVDESYSADLTVTQRNRYSQDLLNRAYFLAVNPKTRYTVTFNLGASGNYIGMDFKQVAPCTFVNDPVDADFNGVIDSWYKCNTHFVWSPEPSAANLPLYCKTITGSEK